MTDGTSPAASGPAGSLFEGRVGAFFLLSLLVRAEPRGLPATTIDRVEFQRASEGNPLDDVIVRAHDSHGKPAVLEIQVKKGITFAPSDPIFRAVVGQITKASRKPEFLISRYELAIAISKTSQKIDGAYQDVLTWARELGDAATFMNRINRPGSANDAMRTFVNTFRSHLREERAARNDESLWRLLRRLQIFVFDFTAPGSISEELAKERAVRALHPDYASRAGELWTTLTELAIRIVASGGDRTRDGVLQDLQQKSFRLTGDSHTFSARTALAEASRNVLADIGDRALHPERESLEVLARMREVLGEYHFAGQYQQAPSPLGGGIIKTEWFKIYTPAELPAEFDTIFQSWDTANKSNELNDYSVCTTWGILKDHLYLLHIFRQRLDYPDLKRAVKQQAEAYKAKNIVIEDKSSGTSLIQDLRADGVHAVTRYEPKLEKVLRMSTVTNIIEGGFVHIPAQAYWLAEYLHELSVFPKGKYDDQVDSTSQALDWVKDGAGKFGLLEVWREQAEKLNKPPASNSVTKRLPHWKRAFAPYW